MHLSPERTEQLTSSTFSRLPHMHPHPHDSLAAGAVWRSSSEVCAEAIYQEPGYYEPGFVPHGAWSARGLNIESMIC
jgi:hypothetical protein